MGDVIKQSIFQSQQNFKINIDQIYNDFIKEIDSIRSYVNVDSISKDNLFNSLKTKSVSKIAAQANIKAERSFQESRCHAFYRLLGFPVIDKNFKFYNPGHDIIKDPTSIRNITKDTKVAIASNLDPKFERLSSVREQIPLLNLNIFSNNTSLDAAVRSLTILSFAPTGDIGAGINFRPFVTPLEDSDEPFLMDFKKYSIGHSITIENNNVSFLNLTDDGVTFPSPQVFSSKHIIRPFMVDPKIDFTAENRICVPFATQQSFTKVSSNNFAQPPIIETIINERFSNADDGLLGTFYNKLKTYITQNDAIKDDALIQKFASGVESLSLRIEQEKLLEFLMISQAMIDILIKSQRVIDTAQGKYYWLPISSTIGPENKGTVRKNIIFSDGVDRGLVTTLDYDIITLIAKTEEEKTSAEAAKANAQVKSNFILKKSSIFAPAASRGFDNTNTATSLNKLLKIRNESLDKANEALRTIEIVLGEFSGLGLCDMIAIVYALYIIPQESLLGLLDDDAHNRAKNSINELDLVSRSDIQTSMNTLTGTVKGLYQIMDKMYFNSLTNHSPQV